MVQTVFIPVTVLSIVTLITKEKQNSSLLEKNTKSKESRLARLDGHAEHTYLFSDAKSILRIYISRRKDDIRHQLISVLPRSKPYSLNL